MANNNLYIKKFGEIKDMTIKNCKIVNENKRGGKSYFNLNGLATSGHK